MHGGNRGRVSRPLASVGAIHESPATGTHRLCSPMCSPQSLLPYLFFIDLLRISAKQVIYAGRPAEDPNPDHNRRISLRGKKREETPLPLPGIY